MRKRFQNNPLLTRVSFGTDIRRRLDIEHRTVHELLTGIGKGEWREHVEKVRSLHASKAYDHEKKKLPYVAWSGRFTRVCNKGLIRHSGIMCIDLDDLTRRERCKVFQRAVADPHCLAAFHSVSDVGVKLLLRVPPMTPDEHSNVFPQVASYVRAVYHVEPDKSGRDVSRLCFVSSDKGMWLNPVAATFPVTFNVPADPQSEPVSKSSPSAKQYAAQTDFPNLSIMPKGQTKLTKSKLGAARLLGMECAPFKVKADGTWLTHKPLLRLSKRLAVDFRKKHLSNDDMEALSDEAFKGWMREVEKNKRRLRGEPKEYRNELSRMLRHALKADWAKRAANHWSQWKEHPKYPRSKSPAERLEWVIREHCAQNETNGFFISSRDAADVAFTKSSASGARYLKSLRTSKIIAMTGKRYGLRQAATYKLLD